MEATRREPSWPIGDGLNFCDEEIFVEEGVICEEVPEIGPHLIAVC